MFEQHVIDFLRGDLLPTAIDDLPAASHDEQISVIVEKTLVPGLEPATRECGLIRRWVAVVAGHDNRAADDDLPCLAVRQQSSRFVHDCEVQIHWHADGTRLAPERRQRIARERPGSGLGHRITIDHTGLKGSLQILEHTGRQRSRGRADEA